MPVQEVEQLRDTDIQELKQGIKDINKVVHSIDKSVGIHNEKLNNLKDVKEVTERTSESAKSAHKRIDEVETELKERVSEIKSEQDKMFNDFKQLVNDSNNDLKEALKASDKKHHANYASIKTFSWKIFFIFATPTAAGIVGLLFLALQNK